jgi:hypothetical protein
MPLSRIGLSQNQQITGNVAFQGTSNRITGDFTNSTVINRVLFQTNTANTSTLVGAIPSGTGTVCSFQAYNNSDPTNSAFFNFGCSNAGTEARLNSAINGSGTYLPMTFYTGGTETARFSSTAKTFILAGGSTSATGTGITFPASQNASDDPNTLDDYEEGSWTPTISGSSSGTVTTGARYGTYTKIGNLVVAQFAIINPGPGTTAISGSWRLSGLPFAQSANFRGYGKVSWKRYIPVNTNGTEMTLFGQLSSTFMNIGWHTNNTNESDYISGGSVAQDTLFEGYMTYYV